MIDFSIKRAFITSRKRGYDVMYVAVDIHDTILVATYKNNEVSHTFYPMALETLKYLSTRKDVVLIMYTCSHPNEIKVYTEFFEKNDIHFKYCNSNPEVKTGDDKYGNYDGKFYFNVLLDDKAGFSADKDWTLVYDTFIENESL